MKFSLAVYSAPHSAQSASSALRFAKTVLQQGHEIYRVFFYCDGVQNGNATAAPPQDEIDLTAEWQVLGQQHQLDLVICIAAAQRRGVLNQREAERLERPAANLADGFELAGLGQLTDAVANSDRLITFGS
ncbi:sulfurtransferase complex subunit TusD [Microbulbifer sp. OS29]|uniref:Sulfurtransferase complex subunit TusD n=1 Tax=Microbulbifer okhotskensis TaxID=2926617 RepID=A0A9X2EU42_9GAMM|nr:sulfurtransferase complex subunit TusD [Microbulbifer okhotskensis]MCO1335888.1 sulfurtransferase complex subunit TusD [Microbulbifer okhotskensis]